MDEDGKLTSEGLIGVAPEWPEKNGKLRMAIRVEQLSEKANIMRMLENKPVFI